MRSPPSAPTEGWPFSGGPGGSGGGGGGMARSRKPDQISCLPNCNHVFDGWPNLRFVFVLFGVFVSNSTFAFASVPVLPGDYFSTFPARQQHYPGKR